MKKRSFLGLVSTLALSTFLGAVSTSSAVAEDSSAVLRVGLYRPIPGVDPSTTGGELTLSIFEGLTRLDSEAQLQPSLATAWKRKDDLTWEFTLREGVRFSDGTPFDAQAVADYVTLLTAEKSTLSTSGRWRPLLAGTNVIDPTTIEVITKFPYLGLPDRFTTLYIGRQVATDGDLARRWVGTGPYVLDRVDLENGASASKNETYWGPKPAWKTLQYSVFPTEEARLLALQAHELDMVVQIDPKTISQIGKDDHYRTGSKASTWNIVLRIKENKGKPLADLRVRQALNYGIDKEAIIRGLFKGSVEPSPGQFLVKGWDELNLDLKAFPYDPEKAKALLAEAGYAKGVKLRLDVPIGSYLAVGPASQVIAAQLSKIGVTMEINTLPFPAWVDLTRKPDGDLVYIGHSPAYRFTPERFTQFKSTYDQSHWTDPAFDAAADRALAAQTPEDLRKATEEATQIFYDNLHAVFLYPQPVTWAVRSDIDWEPRIDQSIQPQFARPKTGQ